jgi:allantoinase
MARDLIGYGNRVPDMRWPNGSRLAVNFVLNYEEGSELSPADGDVERERMSEADFVTAVGDRDLLQESVYEYGSRVGVWRLIDALERHGRTATVFACAVALERNSAVTAAFVERGYDFVSHGYRWIQHYGLSEIEERNLIRKALASIEATTGQRPAGWFTRPLPSERTRTLLVEEGLTFDCDSYADDLPYYVDVSGRQHLVVPYSADVNDIRFWKGSFFVADDWFRYARDAFDTLYAEARTAPRMLTIGLHARIIGRPGRVAALERFLSHLDRFPDIWVCNRTELATHWLNTVPAGHGSGSL